jgi:hypothetical protein
MRMIAGFMRRNDILLIHFIFPSLSTICRIHALLYHRQVLELHLTIFMAQNIVVFVHAR